MLQRTAIVTGAGGGIGSAVVRAISDLGYAVCLVGRTEARLRSTAATTGTPERHLVLPIDISHPDAESKIVNVVTSAFGRLDLLIHGAGKHATSLVEDSDLETLDELYRVNVRAPYALSMASLPLLTASEGQIVFLNSSVIDHPRPAVAQYAVTKHALLGLANCLRAEVNCKGIRVVSIFPGRTATELQERVYRDSGQTYEPGTLLQPEDIAASVVHAITIGRSAEVTDVFVRPMKKP